MTERLAVLRVEEFAALMKISRSLAYKLVAAGQVKAVRLGTTWRIPRHVVDELLNGAGLVEEEGPAEREGEEQ